jgi:hypothetical protein
VTKFIKCGNNGWACPAFLGIYGRYMIIWDYMKSSWLSIKTLYDVQEETNLQQTPAHTFRTSFSYSESVFHGHVMSKKLWHNCSLFHVKFQPTFCVVVLHNLSVCSLSYPACKAHAPYYIVICGLSSFTIFFLIILKTARFSGKGYWTQNMYFDFLYNIYLKCFSF